MACRFKAASELGKGTVSPGASSTLGSLFERTMLSCPDEPGVLSFQIMRDLLEDPKNTCPDVHP